MKAMNGDDPINKAKAKNKKKLPSTYNIKPQLDRE
jgi:hypothetical protein